MRVCRYLPATTYREIVNDDFECAGRVAGFCRFLFVPLLFSTSDLYVGLLSPYVLHIIVYRLIASV